MKLYKISFDAGFTCPNRDGTCGTRGCIFCSEGGSGDFAVKISASIDSQIELAKAKVSKKFKGDKYIAYFQAFTNTYASANVLRQIYMPIIKRDDVAVLSIATRPDCLTDDIYDLLRELNNIKPVWVELGLQTTKKSSIDYIRRGYDTSVYDKAIKKLNQLNIHTITHVILYLPGETVKDMKKTISHVVKAGSLGIKLQLLHVLKGTDLADDFADRPFYLPSLSEYADTLKECLALIPPTMVVHRITGDPPKKLLIEPKWAANKKLVMNTLEEAINPPTPYYVYMVLCEDKTFYTGSTNDVKKRFNAHSTGRGAKYTATHHAVKIIYVEKCKSKRAALSREYAIKQLTKSQKIKLLDSNENIVKEFIQNDNNN